MSETGPPRRVVLNMAHEYTGSDGAIQVEDEPTHDRLPSDGPGGILGDSHPDPTEKPDLPRLILKSPGQGPLWVRLLGLVTLVAVTSCSAPDRSSSEYPPLPEPATAYLQPDTVRGLRVGDGAAYYYVRSGRGPWAVHLVLADAGRCDIRGVVAPAHDGDERHRRRVSTLRPEGPGAPFVGVNGDFFTEEGSPLGPEISTATLMLAARPAFAWSPHAEPWIGVTEVNDGLARFGEGHAGGSVDATGGLQVIGGFPLLLQDGSVVGDLEVSDRPAFATVRHPRTGVGYDKDTGHLWLVVVDGRQADYSSGMSLPEFAQLFNALGVEDALNLDGGGSATMWVRGEVVNRPSDPNGERPVANSLWLTDLPGRRCES